MGAAEIASVGLTASQILWTAAKESGLVGSPDWIKYVDAGLYLSKQLTVVLAEMETDPAAFDNYTPEQILEVLMPTPLDDIKARAYRELGLAPE